MVVPKEKKNVSESTVTFVTEISIIGLTARRGQKSVISQHYSKI
jgi:hypothetical protein